MPPTAGGNSGGRSAGGSLAAHSTTPEKAPPAFLDLRQVLGSGKVKDAGLMAATWVKVI